MAGIQTPSDGDQDPLDLTSLDAESLFAALGAVEKAVPSLLESTKPVLQHLTSPNPDRTAESAEQAIEAYMARLDKIQFVLRQTVYYLRETQASTTALRPPPVGAIPTPLAASLPPSARQPGGATSSKAGQSASGLAGSSSAAESAESGTMGAKDVFRTTEAPAGQIDPAGSGVNVGEGGAGGGSAGEEGQEEGRVELGLYGSRMEAQVLKRLAGTLRRLKQDGLGPGYDGAVVPETTGGPTEGPLRSQDGGDDDMGDT